MRRSGRGVMLWVLVDMPDREKLNAIIFAETSTIGIRSYPVTRVALQRESKEVITSYGLVRVKLSRTQDGRVHTAPEYEDCKRLAREKNLPLKLIYEEALFCARQL